MKMRFESSARRIASRCLALAESILLAAALCYFTAHTLPASWHTLNTDFPNYYCVARLVRSGVSADRAYEWTWLQRQKNRMGIEQPLVGFAPHPPFCAVPMIPLTRFPPLSAKRIWLLLNLGLLAGSIAILTSATALGARRVSLICFLCFIPLESNFLLGQYYVLILFLVCAAYRLSLSRWPFLSGCALGIASALKIFPALFLLLFLFRRQWRSSLGLLTGAAVCTALSLSAFGWEIHRTFLVEVLPRAATGELLGPFSAKWSSLNALFHRMFLYEPELNPAPIINSPLLYALVLSISATILLFAFMARMRDGSDRHRDWATLVCLSLLLSPMPSSYHYCLLIFVAAVATDRLWPTDRLAALLAFLAGSMPVRLVGRAELSTRLIATTALFLLLTKPWRIKLPPKSWSFAAIVLVALSTYTNYRRVSGRHEEFQKRVHVAFPAYRYANPVIIGHDLGLTAMRDNGYVAVVAGHEEVPTGRQGDVLSLAGSPSSKSVYIELSEAESRILRREPPSAEWQFVVAGGEPSVSANGNWLAFVREERGRGSAWLMNLRTNESKRASPDSIDVSTVSVSNSGTLYISGRYQHFLRLFRKRLGEPLPVLVPVWGPVRYAAISPDESQLAFSRLESGSWHLYIRDNQTERERRITGGSCNSTEPSWKGARALVYSNDCGRGLGLTAIAETSSDAY